MKAQAEHCRVTKWVQRTSLAADQGGPKHTGSITHTHIMSSVYPSQRHARTEAQTDLSLLQRKCFKCVLPVEVRHKETWVPCESVCAHVFVSHVCVRSDATVHVIGHRSPISILAWITVKTFITQTSSCSHMHKHNGTQPMCIFMNICAIFERYVILKLVYTGIIL